jgi:carbamoyl-phosphate synthase large subunit
MYGQYLPRKPRRVLVLGSGALQIGQAGEFDYSGSQALKALREEGIATVLINPNIATIQTGENLADNVYFVDVNPEFVERIIVKEEVDALMLSFGGQTALNCGLALDEAGVLARHGVRVLGTPISTIRDTEDRALFVQRLAEIGVKTARSRACQSPKEAVEAARSIGLPIMLRSGYSLGGKGSGIVETESALDAAVKRAFAGGARQVLVEECLRGWKEIEYEVVRDGRDNCITVCNMENFDPMGIHTGESIVVAPTQTLNDEEVQLLRSLAIRTVRHLGVVGECNIQYALDPRSTDYRVIEVNARLSRSSALASKATGYPLAYVAAKLALGRSLPEVQNSITRRTTAFFEPALDYLVCKMPRWDLAKFQGASAHIGSEMKSIGEVMAIGRTFPVVIQKALRMLDIGVHGLDPDAFAFDDVRDVLAHPTPLRVFAVARALRDGMSIDEVHALTQIDRWFLKAVDSVVRLHVQLQQCTWPLVADLLRRAKEYGFSDVGIECLLAAPAGSARQARKAAGIVAHMARIDTLAAEFPADTNYLYTTYHASISEAPPSKRKKILVLGSGPYRIGSSVEFDWCCVNAVQAAAELGFETIMLNSNPETVSTDYDICDRLIFDEISVETVLDLCELEAPAGVVVSMGGQTPNNLAMALGSAGIKVLGTSPTDIDRAEDRGKFGSLLDSLAINQPRWAHMHDLADADAVVAELGGFPVLVRPSYVLSGAAMDVAHEPNELRGIIARAREVSSTHPVVVTSFETHAREFEIDAVADQGRLALWAICEHLEDAGVHSGDATLVMPPQTLYIATIRKARAIAAALAEALRITGPFNLQFLAKNNVVKVIECNLRASRSFPFVSKVTGVNFAREAMKVMLGVPSRVRNDSLNLDHVGVKVPMFSFSRIVGADPMLGVEMTSTGEVGCFGEELHDALLHGLRAVGFRVPTRGVLLSLGPVADKYWFAEEAKVIAQELRLPVFATPGTAEILGALGIACQAVEKQAGPGPNAIDLIERAAVDLVINIPREYDAAGRPDGFAIRRAAVEAGVPLITDLQLARAVIEALRVRQGKSPPIHSWQEYLGRSGLPGVLRRRAH